MKVAYITASVFPAQKASGIQVMQMCAALGAAGAEVTLYGRAHAGMLPASELQQYYDVAPEFAIEQRPFPRGPRPVDRYQARIAWQAGKHGEPWVCYSRSRDLTAPVVALLRRNARVVLEVHGRPVSQRERAILHVLGRHRRSYLVALSPVLGERYQCDFGYPDERVIIAPDGVDLRRFTPVLSREEARARLGLLPGVKLVVYVGGLYAGRGLEALFQAMAGQPARLVIVGGQDEAEIASWQAKSRGLGVATGQVQFNGYQPPAEIPVWLFAADILAMPYGSRTITHSGEETTAWMSPLKLFEYLAAGRPIVATDLPALRTVLTDGHDALLAPPDDHAGLAAALRRLLDDPAFAGQLAANARQTATRYTWQARAKQIIDRVTG